MKTDRKRCIERATRIVVKVGSGVLTEDHGLNTKAIRSISRQMCTLIDRGLELILVTSGAMALGVKKIALPKRPDALPERQAAAAVGQAGLLQEYEKAFQRSGKQVAQILLTGEDLSNRKRYLNARNTLYTLLNWRVVPIINENDTVSVQEIQFGDNDNLSALISLLMDADLLINLTDIDGLYTQDPRVHTDAEWIPVVDKISREIEKLASDIPGALNLGGMLGKIKAAKKVTAAGIPMIIAKGEFPDILIKIFAGRPLGTFFVPRQEKLASRKRWIGFTLKPKGAIVIDDGAAVAIYKKGKSLLPTGIVSVEGDFEVGDSVEIKKTDGTAFATGLANYNSFDIGRIKGLKSNRIKACLGYQPYDEVIHRDNLVVTGEL